MRIISGKYKARRFAIPTDFKARPTTDFARENLFNVLNNKLDFDGLKALDLFSGTGAISLELASRGAEKVISVELNRRHHAHIRKCIDTLQDLSVIAILGDALRFISSTKEHFDFIFADPPYDLPQIGSIPEWVLAKGILVEDGLFAMEHSKRNDFSALPEFLEKREYGSVNFSFFKARVQEAAQSSEESAADLSTI